MTFMLLICDKTIPSTDLTYFAFRVAFCDTLERIALGEQARLSPDVTFGFLTEVPFLRNVPPRIQLDLLLDTWSRHYDQTTKVAATLLDEAVLYAACETAGRLVTSDRKAVRRFLRGGPRPIYPILDQPFADSLQALHVDLSNDGDFLLISQFQDLPPDESRQLKAKFRMKDVDCESLFEALGRWHVASNFCAKSKGLLTSEEALKVAGILQLPKPATV